MIQEKFLNNYESFKELINSEKEVIKYIAPYLINENIFKIDLKGNIIKREVIPYLSLIEIYIKNKNESLLKLIFQVLTNNRKFKIKKINRYSSLKLEKVKENLFKTLINNDYMFALRYGKELFLREAKSFKEILTLVSLINYNYKSAFTFSLFNLTKDFKENLDDLLYLSLVNFCHIPNNLYFYEKAYFIKEKENSLNIKDAINNKDYEALKFQLKSKKKEVLKAIIELALEKELSLTYLFHLQLLIHSYFNYNLPFENLILTNIIAFNEDNSSEGIKELKVEVIKYIKENYEKL